MRKLDYSNGRTCVQCAAFKSQEHFVWKDGKRRLGNRCRDCRLTSGNVVVVSHRANTMKSAR